MSPSACKLFTGIDDPRVISRTTHSLAEILFAALCATLCGFGCCDGYAQFARAKIDFLRWYLWTSAEPGPRWSRAYCIDLYPVHAIIRNSVGAMTRKLSVILSR